jgi:ankyrin repeat protein
LPTEAQETDAQKLLMESINFDKLDVAGVKAALGKGANPNWVSDTPRKSSVIGSLADAAIFAKDEKAEEKSVQILQMLFRTSAKLQPCDQEILYFPIAQGWALFTEILLQNGANPTRQIEGWTPMEIAVGYGQANIVKLLRKYGAPALENRIAAQLILIKAAGDGNMLRMEDALRNGAFVNEMNRRGETALIKAVSDVLSFIRSYDTYTTIRYLIEKGADPNIQGEGGFGKTTALHLAIEKSSVIFEAEIKKKIKDERFKDSPIYARLIIEYLLRHGALVSARDSDGMTPLHIAAKKNNIVGPKF